MQSTSPSSVYVEYWGKIFWILVEKILQCFSRKKLIAVFQNFAEISYVPISGLCPQNGEPDTLSPNQFSEPGCGKSGECSLESNEFLSTNIKDHDRASPHVAMALILIHISFHFIKLVMAFSWRGRGLNSNGRKCVSNVDGAKTLLLLLLCMQSFKRLIRDKALTWDWYVWTPTEAPVIPHWVLWLRCHNQPTLLRASALFVVVIRSSVEVEAPIEATQSICLLTKSVRNRNSLESQFKYMSVFKAVMNMKSITKTSVVRMTPVLLDPNSRLCGLWTVGIEICSYHGDSCFQQPKSFQDNTLCFRTPTLNFVDRGQLDRENEILETKMHSKSCLYHGQFSSAS